MIVNWKEKRIIVIPIQIWSKKDKKFVVKKLIKLVPGINDLASIHITKEEWDVIIKTKIIKNHIDTGKLIEIVTIDDNGNGKKEVSFLKLNSNEAIDMVNETNQIETLYDWKKKENRQDVNIALMDRIKEIEEKRPEKKK